MKEKIIGRKEEQQQLNRIYNSNKSEFVAVCGRRRVGKTFLIREYFEDEIVFQTSGLANDSMKQQIKSFYSDLMEQGLPAQERDPHDWIDIFMLLRTLIKQSSQTRKVILLDELPWMDTPRSMFISALEHFWNSWASARHDIVLIVCGSATSWMMDKLINNHGGLYNRLTFRIFLEPFTLKECEDFIKSKGLILSRYEIAECHMIMGGIPFYLELLDSRLSLSQNIDQLFFRPNGLLAREFPNLYNALFKNSELYIKVVEALSTKRLGLTRNEIINSIKLQSGNGLTTILRNLENCGFIRQYKQFNLSNNNKTIYQLVDFFTLFHFYYLVKQKTSKWSDLQGKAEFYTWAGLTFEILAMQHIKQIKNKLGIIGINTREYAWRCTDSQRGSQIDLIIERSDNTINICEIKYSINPFTIDKEYELNLRNKISTFIEHTHMKKSIQLTFISTHGLKNNAHSSIVNNQITLDDLFQ